MTLLSQRIKDDSESFPCGHRCDIVLIRSNRLLYQRVHVEIV